MTKPLYRTTVASSLKSMAKKTDCMLQLNVHGHAELHTVTTKTPTPGHRKLCRLGVRIKLLDALDLGGKDAALKSITRPDAQGQAFDVSHYRHCRIDQMCVESTHFDLESKGTNARRASHQHGNLLCNCAYLGDKTCLVNGAIGEEVYDEEGAHMGWARSGVRNPKRTR